MDPSQAHFVVSAVNGATTAQQCVLSGSIIGLVPPRRSPQDVELGAQDGKGPDGLHAEDVAYLPVHARRAQSWHISSGARAEAAVG